MLISLVNLKLDFHSKVEIFQLSAYEIQLLSSAYKYAYIFACKTNFERKSVYKTCKKDLSQNVSAPFRIVRCDQYLKVAHLRNRPQKNKKR